MPQSSSIKTLVCFHDLLGYGEMLSASGGSFDSAVGQLAKKRAADLRRRLSESRTNYPVGTKLFHFNDSAVALLDIDVEVIYEPLIDAPRIDKLLTEAELMNAVRFIASSAKLHGDSHQAEAAERIGPGGRTFIVLGDRWDVSVDGDPDLGLAELQANIAFSEAYIADTKGSKAGFAKSGIYAIDFLSFIDALTMDHLVGPMVSQLRKTQAIDHEPEKISEFLFGSRYRDKNDQLRHTEGFASKVQIELFHRTRFFVPVNNLDWHAVCAELKA